jgi:hypothetical protein
MRRNQTLSHRAQTSIRNPASRVSSGRSQRSTRGWRFGSKVRYAKTTAAQMAARLQRKTSTIRRMAPRYFTLEQANQAVEELRPVVEQMVEHHGRFVAAQRRRGELTEQAGANGGDLTPTDFADVEHELEAEATALARCVERIQSAGALVKDLDRGLLDFPALRDGEEILLCWHLGEDAIEYFHGPEEGFAGRKPL